LNNYTIADLIRIFAGFVLFAPFALFPGYTAGTLSNAFRFRERSVLDKLLIASPLSTSVTPLLIYLVGRMGGMPAAWLAIGIAGVAFLFFFLHDLRRDRKPFDGSKGLLIVASCWILLALAILVDIQYNGRLYIAAASFDYSIRNEIVSSITRTGVVPENPFFFPGHSVPLRYHYFFFIPCSMVQSLSGGLVTPGASLAAGTLWCGLALMCLVCLYLHYFRTTETAASSNDRWTGLKLIPVMGLDVIPTSLLLASGIVNFTVDKWNEDLVGWLDSLLWAPHYVAAAIACLIGFLMLWTAAKTKHSVSIGSCLVAGASFACACGMGIYVALVFGAAMSGYIGIALWKGWKDDIRTFVLAGVFAAVLALPYLMSLAETSGANTNSSILYPTVRSFKIVELLLTSINADWTAIAALNLALLPLNYALELGVLFLIGLLQAKRFLRRKHPLGRKEWAGIVLVVIPILICTFFRSGVIANNDLGWRGFLIPQFMLLLWAIGPVRACFRPRSHSPQRIRPWIRATVWLGLAGAILGAIIDRTYMYGVDQGMVTTRNWLIRDQQMSQRLLALRNTYEWIDRNTPVGSRIQANPEFLDIGYGLYGNRVTLASDEQCGTAFGGSASDCAKLRTALLPSFNSGSSDPLICVRFPAVILVVKDTDFAWHDSQSWVWTRKPVYSNQFSRVFACPANYQQSRVQP
jgi:hypothetical protein